MIALARAMLGAFAADRTSVALSLLAPIAFFTLIGSFYAHLERPDGVRIEIVVQDESGTEDGHRLANAVSTCARDPIIVRQGSATSTSGPFATIVLPARFTRREGAIEILSGVPFPGGTGLVRQLVELSAWTAFGPSCPEIPVTLESTPSRLVRDASVGICLVFMMFSVSSLASRGLADDAAGLRRRLAALGVGPLSLSGARAAVMTAVGFAQMSRRSSGRGLRSGLCLARTGRCWRLPSPVLSPSRALRCSWPRHAEAARGSPRPRQ